MSAPVDHPAVHPAGGLPTAGAPPRDLPSGNRFRRIGGGLSLLASGTLVCASLAMIPYESSTDEAYLQTGIDHTGNVLWAAVVLHYGYLLLLPAALTLIRLGRRRMPRTATTAMVLAGLGAGLSGIVAIDFYAVALATELPRDEALRLYEVSEGYVQSSLITLPAVLGVVLGTCVALFVAWRARAIPVAPMVLGIAGWVGFAGFAGGTWLPTATTALVAVALAWCGVVVLRMRDETWAAA
ncbi:hypothetical protein [Trujillonella endophytica]|uniref:DUF4386 domain-containing protein n=1 Tax=Trujillonella endophytica TaxID=673521 RepID=A0A1H8VKM9_9ACTN|nr:hypothetical protein [Trujillella endophytica]SEP15840.1 hypothetical protein SAMN05660991_03628 [Trujillella endophytica]